MTQAAEGVAIGELTHGGLATELRKNKEGERCTRVVAALAQQAATLCHEKSTAATATSEGTSEQTKQMRESFDKPLRTTSIRSNKLLCLSAHRSLLAFASFSATH